MNLVGFVIRVELEVNVFIAIVILGNFGYNKIDGSIPSGGSMGSVHKPQSVRA